MRVAKLNALRERGIEPFALRFDRSHTVAEALNEFAEIEAARAKNGATGEGGAEVAGAGDAGPVRVAGRIVRHRGAGKAGFADLVDGTGKIQLYVHVDVTDEPGMELFRDLDLGDIVGVEGRVMRTRRGEVSIEAMRLQLLTKALRPLPEKWHGLKDPETRFRQRHLDVLVNPDVRRAIELRSRLVAYIRSFLDSRGFIEVETPVLQKVAGGAAARPFLTHHNALNLDLKLRIALELHLKRLVIGGFEQVYEVGRVFRNEGVSVKYSPEFTMLELYQAYTDYQGIMELVEDLLRNAAAALLGGERITYQGAEIDLKQPWPRRDMVDLVKEAVPNLDTDDAQALRREAAARGALNPESLDWGAALVEVFERTAEDRLQDPIFVTGHPISVSPLARRRLDDARLVERFELYIAGREIADAFSELTDPLDQRARFEQQLAARAAGAEETHPMDEDFLAALEQGMPPTGGLGVGIDRLAALFADVPSIRDVITFPLLRDAPEDNPPTDRVADRNPSADKS